MTIDHDSPDKYKPEYDVSIRRLTDFLAQTSAKKEAMGAAISVIQPGETVREHINKPDVEEIFLLLDGTATFRLGEQDHAVSAGDIGFARVGEKHSFTNSSNNTVRLLSIWWKAVAE